MLRRLGHRALVLEVLDRRLDGVFCQHAVQRERMQQATRTAVQHDNADVKARRPKWRRTHAHVWMFTPTETFLPRKGRSSVLAQSTSVNKPKTMTFLDKNDEKCTTTQLPSPTKTCSRLRPVPTEISAAVQYCREC